MFIDGLDSRGEVLQHHDLESDKTVTKRLQCHSERTYCGDPYGRCNTEYMLVDKGFESSRPAQELEYLARREASGEEEMYDPGVPRVDS